MLEEGHYRVLTTLPPLDQEDIEDAEFRAKDRAWSSLVRVFEAHRERDGLTFDQLGKRVDRERTQVHRWFSSPMKMTLRALGLLAEGLDADIEIRVIPRKPEARCPNHLHPSEAAQTMLKFNLERVTVVVADTRGHPATVGTLKVNELYLPAQVGRRGFSAQFSSVEADA